MTSKTINLPFDVKMAKQIIEGEQPGEILFNESRKVRIISFDAHVHDKEEQELCALVEVGDGLEDVLLFRQNGCMVANERDKLTLRVPEWTTYKPGEILVCECAYNADQHLRWMSIPTENLGYNFNKSAIIESAADWIYMDDNGADRIEYYCTSDNVHGIRRATHEEINRFRKRLEKENTDKARIILEKYFKKEPECPFQPFDKVLVRDSEEKVWMIELFERYDSNRDSYRYVCLATNYKFCIPYNEETKHLLGTSDNWEN